ncbi:MAG: hypothetical protein ACRDFW_04745, partial [bacterium]
VEGYGVVKVLLQQRRLVLPREPELLRQLAGLRMTFTEGGTLSIRHDEHSHDDLAIALMLSVRSALGLRRDAGPLRAVPSTALTETEWSLVVERLRTGIDIWPTGFNVRELTFFGPERVTAHLTGPSQREREFWSDRGFPPDRLEGSPWES